MRLQSSTRSNFTVCSLWLCLLQSIVTIEPTIGTTTQSAVTFPSLPDPQSTSVHAGPTAVAYRETPSMAGNDQVTVHKRAAAANERDYNFGLGKRAPDWKGDSTEYDSSPESGVVEPGIRLHPQLLAQLTQLLNEQQQKRSDQLNRYAFGLGKREPTDRYAFGLGKRANDPTGPYQFGLGKRAMPDGRYEFGLGKRDPVEARYNFGLGKRIVPDTSNNRVLRQKTSEGDRFAFGLGKRDPVDRRFEDFIKRRFSFGIGKRSDDERFAFGLGK